MESEHTPATGRAKKTASSQRSLYPSPVAEQSSLNGAKIASDNCVLCSLPGLILLDFSTRFSHPQKAQGNTALQSGAVSGPKEHATNERISGQLSALRYQSVAFTIHDERIWSYRTVCHVGYFCDLWLLWRGVIATFRSPGDHLPPSMCLKEKQLGLSLIGIAPDLPSTGAPQHTPPNVARSFGASQGQPAEEPGCRPG